MASQTRSSTRPEGHQEGSRWINRRPEPEELARWFADNVKMHDGLSHADYLPGITLIPNKEKVKTVTWNNGEPSIVEVEQLVFTPYPKVDTRIQYFWDLMAAHPEWLGKIRLVPADPPHPNLPAGFFHHPVTLAEGRQTHFLGVRHQIEVTDRRRGQPVFDPPAATKIVPMLRTGYAGKIYADENAIARAETGSIGRALGFAGMLVVPGSGVATAEDMLEFVSGSAEAGPQLPPPTESPDPGQEPDGASLEELVPQLVAQLESEHPQAYEEARAWAAEKGYDLASPPEAALRGLERQLRRKLLAAEAAAAAE